MKTGLRLTVRKTRLHFPQMISLILLLTVGVCFFITLFTISKRYEETAERYFIDNAYADVTFYGSFNMEDIALISEQNGVLSAEGRTVQDFREEELIYLVISQTDSVNKPYIYEGRLPDNNTECLMLRKNALALGLTVGDIIKVNEMELTITGLAASPEYIYLAQNERTMMAQPDSFAVLFVTEDFYNGDYNEAVVLTGNSFSLDQVKEAVGVFQETYREDQLNHYLYRNDLDEIGTFAYIFPLIFAVLIAAVIYVMLSRTVQKDRKQIGTMKALGMTDGKIIRIYLLQFCFAALIGALLGCFMAMLISDGIIGIFSSMFEVPALSFAIYPTLWTGAVSVSVTLCMISGLTALFSILPMLPANAMRPRAPKGGRRIWLEKVSFWKHLSWGTRYAFKNALRNKSRFFAVILGMSGSCGLLMFSLGFNDSIGSTQDKYFNVFANYDAIINFDLTPTMFEHPALARANTGYKALVMPVEIEGENYVLAVVEEGFDMVNIPRKELLTGIIIPEYFADIWNVGAGDTLEVDGHSTVISAVAPQYLGLTLYTGYEYMNNAGFGLPPVYNAVYARSDDLEGLTAFLKSNNMSFTTVDDDRTSFDSIMESMSVLIWFMVACSVVLGITVLYSVGLINLSAREYEYMFMGVMGYPLKGIMSAHIKEQLLQLALAILIGFATGNFLLASIKGEFSGSSFVISAEILPQSYFISALAVICVTAIMCLVTSRHINRLDIVEGLKARDE